MFSLLLFLFTLVCSTSFTMEKPVAKTFYASREVFVQAIKMVSNDRLKRLDELLHTHTFAPEQMAELLKNAMGDKELHNEFMASFVLLLQHGAPVNLEMELGQYVDDGKQKATLLEIALMSHPAYAKPLLMFGAKFNAQQTEKMRPYFQKQENQPYMQECNAMARKCGNQAANFLKSQISGKQVPLAIARKRFAHDASICLTYQEAVSHEDHEALKHLLAQPFKGSAEQKSTQLNFAFDEAVVLDDVIAIDELVKYKALIVRRLGYFFLDHPNLIVHCARNNYITLEDLNNYKARIPEKRLVARYGDSENKYKAEKEAAFAAIETAERLLTRPEPEVVAVHKKVKSEKKDEQL